MQVKDVNRRQNINQNNFALDEFELVTNLAFSFEGISRIFNIHTHS